MFRINPDEDEPVVKELTIDQIINGGSGFPGLVPFMERFLQDTATEIETSCQIKVSRSIYSQLFIHFQTYIDIIAARASGKLMTTSTWIRDFVTSHSQYKKDSMVSDQIVADLTREVDSFVHGRTKNPKLLPDRCC